MIMMLLGSSIALPAVSTRVDAPRVILLSSVHVAFRKISSQMTCADPLIIKQATEVLIDLPVKPGSSKTIVSPCNNGISFRK